MRCHVCGAVMGESTTDLPFKVTERSIVVVRDVPVIQCSGCREYLLSDSVMERLDELLAAANTKADLELLTFAA